MSRKSDTLNNIQSGSFFLIAGPCVIENEQTPLETAKRIQEIADRLDIAFVFKSSYRKANRSSLDSFTGIGDQEGLKILSEISQTLDIPVTTDIHSVGEAKLAAEAVDIIQIPAFLCRQTDILLAAAATKKIINIKKGQFMSPEAMQFAYNKVASVNENIMMTERGSSFGYQDLLVDFTSVKKMQRFCDKVVVDCTHSLQKPNQSSGVTGGDPEMIGTIAKAATAVGANGLFIETHPDPAKAKCDGANMLHLDKLDSLLSQIVKIKAALS